MLRPIRALGAAVTATALLATAACGSSGSAGAEKDRPSKTVVIASHDSWAMDKKVLAEFTKESGYTVKVQPQGDAGQLTNKLVLTKDSPIADGVFGIDNTFASRAYDEGVLTDFTAKAAPTAFALDKASGGAALTPIDYGDVCVNIDKTWFASKKVVPPKTLDDLTKPEYKGLFVTPAANTSSPGLAFLLTTIGKYGDQWPSYWKKLVANDVKIASGWSDAYEVDFTAGGGKGARPIVLSYSSSPPFTVPKGGTAPTTSALLDTCFRQVEYAGVLKGASNPKGAEAFIEFMLGKQFQSALPEQMYVYPVTGVALPADWAKFAPVATAPVVVPPADIAKHRSEWLTKWRDLTTR